MAFMTALRGRPALERQYVGNQTTHGCCRGRQSEHADERRAVAERCGLRTEGYSSAEAFLSHATPAKLGCVVLDMHLVDMSGMELRRRLKTAHSRLPVIFITAIDDDALELEARRVGCLAYLQKPFAAASLYAAVKEALAGDATD